MTETDVLQWVREAPLSDPQKIYASPNFSYDEWLARGRAIPHVGNVLLGLLNKEDLKHPSGDGMRLAYAFGWLGSRGQPAIGALTRCLGSKDITLRIEAVAALGRVGDNSVVPLLESFVQDHRQDKNIRGNACISLGRLQYKPAESVLAQAAKDPDPFIVVCAQEALKLLQAKQ